MKCSNNTQDKTNTEHMVIDRLHDRSNMAMSVVIAS